MRTKIFLFLFLLLKTFHMYPQITIKSSDELIAFARSNSQEIILNNEYMLLKLKTTKKSITPFLPQFNLSWQEYDRINYKQNDIRTKTITASITQLLFDNGKTKTEYLYNRQTSFLEYMLYQKTIKEYELNLIEKYYNHQLLSNTLILKEQLLENSLKDLNAIKYKFENGLITKSDLLEYEIYCNKLENEILNYKNQIQINIFDIKEMLNIPEETDIYIEDYSEHTINETNTLKDKKTQIITDILRNDIEIQQLQNTLNYERKLAKTIKRFYFPSIYLSGGISFTGISYPLTQPEYNLKLIFTFDSVPFVKPNLTTNSGVNYNQSKLLENSLSANIIPEINYFDNKKIAAISLKQAELKLSKKEREISRKAIEYIFSHDNLLSQIKINKTTQTLMKEKLDILKYEAENGLVTYSEYIKQIIDFSEVSQALIQQIIQFNLLLEKIKYLTGESSLYE